LHDGTWSAIEISCFYCTHFAVALAYLRASNWIIQHKFINSKWDEIFNGNISSVNVSGKRFWGNNEFIYIQSRFVFHLYKWKCFVDFVKTWRKSFDDCQLPNNFLRLLLLRCEFVMVLRKYLRNKKEREKRKIYEHTFETKNRQPLMSCLRCQLTQDWNGLKWKKLLPSKEF
jgi:hypothetical protein